MTFGIAGRILSGGRSFIRLVFPLLACLPLLSPVSTKATTIGFDDINASAGDITLDSLSPYQGYNWTNFSVYTNVSDLLVIAAAEAGANESK